MAKCSLYKQEQAREGFQIPVVVSLVFGEVYRSAHNDAMFLV